MTRLLLRYSHKTPADYEDDHAWLQEPQQQFEWLGERGAPASQYEAGVFHREGFKVKGGDGLVWEFRVGDVASVRLPVADDKGDIGANSIGKLLAILEDPKGHCWLTLHYFWRWGQIHRGADTLGEKHGHPRLTAPPQSAELFLQAEDLTAPYYLDTNCRNAVMGPKGVYREPVSVASLDWPVTVLTYQQVLQRYPGLSGAEALQAYEDDHRAEVEEGDNASGARKDFFFWRYLFDHTAYVFKADPAACGASAIKHLPSGSLAMADIFCGAGHVAVAARMAGFDVTCGADASGQAISSFLLNTADRPEGAFNASGSPVKALHCTVGSVMVEELLELISSSSEAAAALKGTHYLHFSPPCQDLSKAKNPRLKRFTGATLMAVPQLVEALQPIFITLEEVHGVIIHQFPKEGLQVWQEASRQKARRERRQRRQQQQQGSSQAPAGASSLFGGSSTQQAAASAAAGDGGEEDGGDEEESVEGEEEEGEDEEEAAAAETEEALRAAGDGDEETPNGSKVFRPFLLLVPQLLALGYQVRMCLLNSAEYGLAQGRWRVLLFAAKIGYELPSPPPPRYERPSAEGNTNGKVLVNEDASFLFKGLDAEGKPNSASWYKVLRAAVKQAALAAKGLLPHVNIAEVAGDLPPVMTSSSSSSVALLQQQLQGPNSWHLEQQQQPGDDAEQAAAAAAGSSTITGGTHLQQQPEGGAASMGSAEGGDLQDGGGSGDADNNHHQQQPRELKQRLASMRAASEEAARQQAGRPKLKGDDAGQWGRHALPYQPRQGMLLYPLPPDSAVAGLRPVSAYAQYMRSPHWPGQALGGFNPLLLHHQFVRGAPPKAPGRHDALKVMKPLGVVGTVVGKDMNKRASVHFAETRRSTHLERRRLQGTPDWFQYTGSPRSIDQQLGNAIPYVMAAEIAASVILAATGTDGQRPPALVGPSPAGWGLTAGPELQRYTRWYESTPFAAVVLGSRAALAAQLGEADPCLVEAPVLSDDDIDEGELTQEGDSQEEEQEEEEEAGRGAAGAAGGSDSQQPDGDGGAGDGGGAGSSKQGAKKQQNKKQQQGQMPLPPRSQPPRSQQQRDAPSGASGQSGGPQRRTKAASKHHPYSKP